MDAKWTAKRVGSRNKSIISRLNVVTSPVNLEGVYSEVVGALLDDHGVS